MPSKFGNAFMSLIIRSSLWPLVGKEMAVVTVTGRKSGNQISTPINVFELAGKYWVISSRSRSWWRNLIGGAPAALHVSGKTIPVEGQVFESVNDVTETLTAYLSKKPAVARYLGVSLGINLLPDQADLDRVAAERVMIHLVPTNE